MEPVCVHAWNMYDCPHCREAVRQVGVSAHRVEVYGFPVYTARCSCGAEWRDATDNLVALARAHVAALGGSVVFPQDEARG